MTQKEFEFWLRSTNNDLTRILILKRKHPEWVTPEVEESINQMFDKINKMRKL